MRNVLLYFALKYNGQWEQIYKALERKEKISDQEIEKVEKLKLDFITILDEEYPRRLKRIYKPPFVLFYKGDLKKLNYKKGISIIGSREASQNGLKNTSDVVKGLKDFTIVSGMAKGIDAKAHHASLEYGNNTIAILGSGINQPYPKENIDLYNSMSTHALILSEYPDKSAPEKENFKDRNRIISGLGDGVLVVEAKKRSGTMNTVKHALQQNKDVFCFPSSTLKDSGTNALIKEGAMLVESAKDIMSEIK